MLQSENQRLRSENTALQDQLDQLTYSGIDSEPSFRYDQFPAATLQEISQDSGPRVRPAALSKNNQGYIAFNRSQYDKAIELFQDAIQSDSRSAVAHYNLGCIYLEIEEYTKAVNYLQEAVALNPDFKEACYNLALAYLKWGYHQEAIKAAHTSLEVDENYLLAQKLLEAIE